MPGNLPKPTELGFAEFVSQLISETLQAVVTSMIQQEKQIRELEGGVSLNLDEFAERFIDDEMVRNEILRIFPPDEKGASSVDAGAPYTPQNKDTKESPQIYSLIGYKMSEKDFEKDREGRKRYTITAEGYTNISQSVKKLSAAQYKSAMTSMISRGIPRVVVDHGKINSKISIYLRAEEERKTEKTSMPLTRSFLPALMVQPVNNRSPEFLSLNVNVIGEVEITFKTINI